MNEMIERVAKAIVNNYGTGMVAWDYQPEYSKELARKYAKGAIAAMREDGGQMVWDMPRDEWIARGGSGEFWDQIHSQSTRTFDAAAPEPDPTGREPIDWSTITRDCSA